MPEYKPHIFSQHSKKERLTLHPDLRRVCDEVLPYFDFRIQQGHRSKEDQDQQFAEGDSKVKWPNSNHNAVPSNAMDLYPYIDGEFIGWDTNNRLVFTYWVTFINFVLGMSQALYEMGEIDAPLRSGADWDEDWDITDHKLVDMPHFERKV